MPFPRCRSCRSGSYGKVSWLDLLACVCLYLTLQSTYNAPLNGLIRPPTKRVDCFMGEANGS
jgi:hypothetical protein